VRLRPQNQPDRLRGSARPETGVAFLL
jgi:hypothetical protein